jgi:class 3 adenylate cyclase
MPSEKAEFLPPLESFSASAPWRLLLWGLWMGVFILFPAWVFEQSLGNIENRMQSIQEAQKEERASELIARFDRCLDRTQRLTEALPYFDRFIRRVWQSGVSEKTLAGLEKRLRTYFPERTRFIWFDGDRRMLVPVGGNLPRQGKRLWQAFFDVVLGPEPASSSSERLALGMIKSLFGDLVSVDMFKNSLKKPQLMFVEGQRHLVTLRVVRHPGSATIEGGVALLIPVEGGLKMEYLKRVIRFLQTGDRNGQVELGGVWRSRETGFSSLGLNQSLMFGLWERFSRDASPYHNSGMVFRGKPWSQDQDFFLVVGIGEKEGAGVSRQQIGSAIRWGLAAGVFLAGILGLWVAVKNHSLTLSLQTKFRVLAGGLALFPSLILVLWSVSFGLQVFQNHKAETWREIQFRVDRFEELVGGELAAIEQELIAFTREKDLLEPEGFDRSYQEILPRIRKMGVAHFLFFGKNGFEKSFGMKEIDPHTELTLAHLKLGPRKENSSRKRSSLTGLASEMKTSGILSRADHLQAMVTSNSIYYHFYSILYDRQGKRAGYASMGFDFNRLRRYLLAQARREEKRLFPGKGWRWSFYLMGDSDEAGVTASAIVNHPLQRSFGDIHKTVEFSGNQLQVIRFVGAQTIYGLARSFQQLKAVLLLAHIPRGIRWQIRQTAFLTLLILVATFGAIWLALQNLFAFLLRPLLDLHAVVQVVDHGQYRVSATILARDEHGMLADRFNTMIGGLQEKERMGAFLPREVVSQAAESKNAGVRRRFAVVLFAGIRGFSRLETTLSPRVAMALMTRFLGCCEKAVKQCHGDIDKFIGDTAMAVFFGESESEAAEHALEAALELNGEVCLFLEERGKLGLPVFSFGVGIAGGEVVVGAIGSLNKRLDHTVIGDPVNMAARIEKLAGLGGRGALLVAADLAQLVKGRFSLVPTDITSLRGKKAAIAVMEVVPR